LQVCAKPGDFNMANKLEVQVTGQSKYEVAHLVATNILRGEKKDPSDRKAYLNAIVDAIDALSGLRPK
jgi:hypothetical protein